MFARGLVVAGLAGVRAVLTMRVVGGGGELRTTI